MMKFLQKLGKALMLPVACLPICGILMGLGYALCPSTMQGGDVVGIVQQIGFYLVKAGGALIDNMAILFAIGIGVGMSEDNDGTGGLAALASWLMLTTLLSVGAVSVIKTLEEGTTAYIAFSKIQNPLIGIIAGVIGQRNKAAGLAVILQRQTLRSYRSRCCFYRCIRSSAVRMAGTVWRSGCTGRRYRKDGSCRCWYLRILQPSADPVRSASRTEQRILV